MRNRRRLVQSVVPVGTPEAVYCARCHQRIVYLVDVGWVDPHRDSCFDMCERDPYGNHWPDESSARVKARARRHSPVR
jgi:hypothetical protein